MLYGSVLVRSFPASEVGTYFPDARVSVQPRFVQPGVPSKTSVIVDVGELRVAAFYGHRPIGHVHYMFFHALQREQH